jgi:hypothetical protein
MTSSSRPSNRMDIDSPVQSLMPTGKLSCPPGKWCIPPTTNNDTPMPDFNHLVMDPDEEIVNTCRDILDDEKPKFYRYVISGPNANL